MGLAEVQSVLARLFTDEALRARFFVDPPAIGRSLGLTEAEATGLANLSTPQVSRFAATLLHKRTDEARKLLSFTARCLGDGFAPAFLECVSRPSPPGRHRDDAPRFALHLARLARSGRLDPPWAADLARYELAFRDAQRARGGFVVRRYRFPVGQIAATIARGEPIGSVRARLRVGVWLRIPGQRELWHRLF